MLTEKQISEIREHLERAQNPVFLYDNDGDGLCSFLIIRRALGRGKGVAIRSYPDLNAQYAKKIQEFGSDYVFVLDKPTMSAEFADEIAKMHLPIVWIDHHDVPEQEELKKFDNIHKYNSAKTGKPKDIEPTTYLAYKIIGRKEEMWIAMIGCISDRYMPDFAEEFKEHYAEFWGKVKEPFDAYYKTEIGRIAMALSFGLKDSISNVVRLQNFLVEARNPGDVLSEVSENKNFRKRYFDIKKKFDLLLERVKENDSGKLIFFDYSGDLSISADLANQICYLYPDKYVAIAYRNGQISNISLRGKNVRRILLKILGDFQNASGGGHEDAVGARIRTEDLEKFKNKLEAEIIDGKSK